jgi:hypothetical protein
MAMLAWCSLAPAQTPPPPQASALPRVASVGVFSLLGDSVQVVSAGAPTDTRIDRNTSQTLDFKDIGFDLIALTAARQTLQRLQPQATLGLLRATAELTPDEQRAVSEGAGRGELPAWMVRSIEARKFSHVLVIARDRGPMEAGTRFGETIGRGSVQGIGFYLDGVYRVENSERRTSSIGLIAAYVQIRLTLMDTQTAAVLRTQDVRIAEARAPSENTASVDPWTFLTPTEKVVAMREMVERGVARGVGALLTAP